MEYFVGIDAGSSYSKAVVLGGERLISYRVVPSAGKYRIAATKAVTEALAKVHLSLDDIKLMVATGYGRDNVPFPSQPASDTACQCQGAFHLFPQARTIIDIGSQFSRVSRMNNEGKATGFIQSDRCATGSGRFLQVMAHVLRIELEEIGPLSLKSRQKLDFSTGCAVFAESEVISRIAEGAAKEDILAAVHRALAVKIQNLMERVEFEPGCVLIGGGAKDIGLVRSLEERLSLRLLVPEEPQIIAALGAALIASSHDTMLW